MIKNKLRLTLKLFLILWFLLFLQVILKITFNYWQPYVIPTPQLEMISDFIDSNRWIEILLNGILYTLNGILMFLTAIKRWWFKNKTQMYLIVLLILINFPISILYPNFIVGTLIIVIVIPLILNIRQWYFTIASFLFSNIFMLLSLWLEGFVNSNDMQYICKVFLQIDYYIMLVLNYILFNLIRIKKEEKNNG